MLTGTHSEAASYEFTTLTCIPGIIHYKDTKIQLLDLPGIIEGASEGKGRGRQVIAVSKSSDIVLMILDASKSEGHRQILTRELEAVGLRLNKRPPQIYFKKKKTGGISFNSTAQLTHVDEKLCYQILHEYKIHNAEILFRDDATVDDLIDVIEGNRKYMKCIYVYNKIDVVGIDDVDRLSRQPNSIVISCNLQTAALCWFREEGEPARECWIALSDSDSEDSDYEATHRGGGKRGSFIRVVNTEPYIESLDWEDGGYKSDSPDGNIIIYPSPDHHQHSRYPHAHLRDFSQTAIKKYNHDTGNRFEFVELVEASVRTMLEYAHIVVIFKACQSSDDTTDTTSFRAETRSASKSLSGDSFDIETVVPLHSNSDISSAPGSESDS